MCMGHWYEEAIFYHIYPLGFCGVLEEGQKTEKPFIKLQQWMHHVKQIGCDALYIGPLFDSVVHGYDTRDYKQVDRRLGDNDAFRQFVQFCHTLGIKVVVDGVFNHTGREFFAFLDMKQNREQSAYRDWYEGVDFGGNNEYGDGFSYASWRGYQMLPKLNLKNPQVRQYLLDVIQYWIQTFEIDGIRLDCADVLDFTFMKEMRTACDRWKDDFWLMGEVIHGDYSRWVNQEMLHAVTNYELHKALYSAHNTHNYFEIAHNVKRLFDPAYGLCKDAKLYSFADNHDVDRLMSKLTNQKDVYAVYLLLYTLPGIPSLYYGSEFGIEGKKENGSDANIRPALCAQTYWKEEEQGIVYQEPYQKLCQWICQLAQIRRQHPALAYGGYEERYLTNEQYAFVRKTEQETILACVNNGDHPVTCSIPMKQGESEAIDLCKQTVHPCRDGKLEIEILEEGGRVFLIR